MTNEGVVVLGIPIPSSSPVFLSIVAVHVAAGLTCTVAGIVAMLAPKRSGRHPSAGTVYYWSLVVVFLSMAALFSHGQPILTSSFLPRSSPLEPARSAEWRNVGFGPGSYACM